MRRIHRYMLIHAVVALLGFILIFGPIIYFLIGKFICFPLPASPSVYSEPLSTDEPTATQPSEEPASEEPTLPPEDPPGLLREEVKLARNRASIEQTGYNVLHPDGYISSEEGGDESV